MDKDVLILTLPIIDSPYRFQLEILRDRIPLATCIVTFII